MEQSPPPQDCEQPQETIRAYERDATTPPPPQDCEQPQETIRASERDATTLRHHCCKFCHYQVTMYKVHIVLSVATIALALATLINFVYLISDFGLFWRVSLVMVYWVLPAIFILIAGIRRNSRWATTALVVTILSLIPAIWWTFTFVRVFKFEHFILDGYGKRKKNLIPLFTVVNCILLLIDVIVSFVDCCWLTTSSCRCSRRDDRLGIERLAVKA